MFLRFFSAFITFAHQEPATMGCSWFHCFFSHTFLLFSLIAPTTHQVRAFHLGCPTLEPKVYDVEFSLGTWKQYKFDFNFLFSKKIINHSYFFTCILLDYVPHDSPKNFEKISVFENKAADFLLTCQKSKVISLICRQNIDSSKQKLSFVHDMVPPNDQKIIYIQCRLYLVIIVTIKGHYL